MVNGLRTGLEADVKAYLIANVLYFGVGDSSTAPTTTDTALGNELLRQAIQEYDDSGTNSVVFSGFVGSGQLNGSDLKEYAFFKSATGTPMYSRDLNTTLGKIAAIEVWYDETMEFEVEINYT